MIDTGEEIVTTQALIDSGAQINCVHPRWIAKHRLVPSRLKHPMKVFNADGTTNSQPVCHQITLDLYIQQHPITTTFLVTNIGKTDIILGYQWLQQNNPSIDWQTGEVAFPTVAAITTAM